MTKKLCIFDFDGTLFDSVDDVIWCFNRVLEEYGFPTLTRDEYIPCLGGNIDDIISKVLGKNSSPQNVEIIKEYTKFIPNINFLKKGKTPLMYASEYYEQTDVIKFLLENGADPYIISSEKKNAFSYAKENAKIVKDSVYWSLNVSALNKR